MCSPFRKIFEVAFVCVHLKKYFISSVKVQSQTCLRYTNNLLTFGQNKEGKI
ncbi:unnamed protein product [Meloidogyne enterolobii]|uniref:Uncharacterized protein n=1 Tax=Meloidogyne enterolobii TaxID=390850 RepID=A0ACB0YMX2_MELEN